MKFKRENIKVALTQEMKEQAVAAKAREIKIKKEAEEKKKTQIQKIQKTENELHANAAAISAREYSYGSIQYQLDLLWHDMDRGAVVVDKTDANTWYHHIKTVKEKNALAADWREQYQQAFINFKQASNEYSYGSNTDNHKANTSS